MCRATAIVMVFLAASMARCEQPGPPAEKSPADQLYQTAMKFELEHDNNYRNMTLRAALLADKDLSAAHWQLGELQREGAWVTVADYVATLSATLSEYAQRRDAAAADAEAEFALAKWCRAHALQDREQLHLIRTVLNPRAAPSLQKKAAKRLKLRQVNGQWLTEQQLKEIKDREAKLLSEFEEWAPTLAQYRAAIQGSSARKRDRALSQLAEVTDPAAVPALEEVFLTDNERLALLAVNTLGNIADHTATASLSRIALVAPWPSAATTATDQLKTRPLHEYVPLLLAQLDTPIQLAATGARVNGQTSVTQQQVLFKEGLASNQMVVVNRMATVNPWQTSPNRTPVVFRFSQRRGSRFQDVGGNPISTEEAMRRLADYPDIQAAIASAERLDADLADKLTELGSEAEKASKLNVDVAALHSERLNKAAALEAAKLKQTVAKVASENARIAASNARVFAILRETTGQILADQATAWWDWWHDYNELSSDYINDAYDGPAYDYKQTTVTSYYAYLGYAYEVPWLDGYNPIGVQIRSCFAAETPVWTDMGLRPIANLHVGDRVLAQHPETGELTFAVVLEHTVRPPSEIMTVRVGGETIACTKGHPFWVNGSGWKMAKLLKAGDAIHGLEGAHVIESVDAAAWSNPAHNLVVAGLGDYFVGKQGLLVHDNTYRAPTRAIIPGYVPEPTLAADHAAMK